MKKIFATLVVLVSFTSLCSAQDTIFGVWPYYHYNWMEYWPTQISHDDAYWCVIAATGDGAKTWCFGAHPGRVGDFSHGDPAKEIAVQYRPDSGSLTVRGMAFLVSGANNTPSWIYSVLRNGILYNGSLNADYVIINCNVYDKNMVLLHTQPVTLSTVDTARVIPFGQISAVDDHGNNVSHFVPFCDIFFDTPLVLADTFYVSITMVYEGDTALYPNLGMFEEDHLNQVLDGVTATTRLLPWETRLYRDTLITGQWHVEENGWHITGLFPIIGRDGDTCPQVGNVELYKGSSTQFFLKWGRGTNHYDWQVSYGPLGIAPEDGTMLTFTQPQSSLITVDPDSQYVAYVRARCRFARDEWGPWSYPVNIWLNGSNGIGSVQRVPDFTLTPNPASGTVTVGGFEGEGSVEIVDMAGRVSGQWPVAGGQRTIDISRLPAGSYVVRLTTAEGTASRMLQVE